MANPAECLLNMLRNWSANTNAYADPTQQRIAARHIEAIDELLSQMDAVGKKTRVYRNHFDRWVVLVYHHPHEWEKGTNVPMHKDERALENLELLADQLDDLVPQLNTGGLDVLRKYAEDARTFVSEDDSIDESLKQHVLRVIAHLDWCIENSGSLSDSDLQDALERLLAAMLRTATYSSDSKKWVNWIMTNTVWPFTVNVAASIPAAALVQLMSGH